MSRETDIAWAAGFLEGEGHFGWWGVKNPHGYRLRGYPLVAASQNNRAPLDRLREIFEVGTVRFQYVTSAGNDHFEWRVTNSKAIDVMAAVFSQMSALKQERIKDVVARYAEREVELISAKLEEMRVCPQGHLRSEHGARVQSGQTKGRIYCRACARDQAARQREKLRAET